ncbi:MAG: sigma-54 dependent transcriptional regulator [candidate division Zixibacteria bacterium]|nr:sigma-54 dependent transcriptional regulator [candidate division Zixibacteria bacterium]MDH3938269.1 sigma-54 dependent transcriptional regulator [candidate division Zixibacteria bacterium]MDH4035597.1 sigma-54 dependent transcriptional regulator [candidate division Zixibacteria bacterium]
MRPRILIIDDEPNITSSFASLLADEGYSADCAADAENGLKLCDGTAFDLILLDLNLPRQSGIDFLKQIKRTARPPLVLVISGQTEIPVALDAMKLGAVDYLEKPVSAERLVSSVRAALMLAKAEQQRAIMADEVDAHSRIIGQSNALDSLLGTIDQAAPTDVTVLIEGENGTGKELVATRIHLESKRRDRPFIKVNCPGVPETLFESELFGHRKGAFTGAVRDFPGKFALADSGTIFLDEVGDLPLSCQAKLLRVLETGEVETLGDPERRRVDVRVIAATNRNLSKLIAETKFREDLYYRLSVFPVKVPPLRQRIDDVPLLVGEFLRRFDPSGGTTLSSEALAYLTTLDYPGNVRQLKNIIERLTIVCSGSTVVLDDLILQLSAAGQASVSPSGNGLNVRLRIFEKHLIQSTLAACGGNISEAARLLEVDRANLSRKIKEFGLKDS